MVLCPHLPDGALNQGSLAGAVVFVDAKTALRTRGGDNMVSVLNFDGTTVTIDPRPVTTGMGPYTLDINAAHTLAAVSSMGRGDGDQDSVSLIDLSNGIWKTASPGSTVRVILAAVQYHAFAFSAAAVTLCLKGGIRNNGNLTGVPKHLFQSVG